MFWCGFSRLPGFWQSSRNNCSSAPSWSGSPRALASLSFLFRSFDKPHNSKLGVRLDPQLESQTVISAHPTLQRCHSTETFVQGSVGMLGLQFVYVSSLYAREGFLWTWTPFHISCIQSEGFPDDWLQYDPSSLLTLESRDVFPHCKHCQT